ncbi:MAG: M23 family metallopeptidase [Smithellaceae bacterium]|nr:M23 family metallopeptidase [Smithellaceae bacterium]
MPVKKLAGRLGAMTGLVMLILISATALPAADKNVEIRYLAQGKKVIPVISQIGIWTIMDIKLPDLVVTNRGKGVIAIDRVEVTGKSDGTESVRLHIPFQQMKDAIKNAAAALNKKTLPLPSLQIAYGNMVLPEGLLSETGAIEAGQSVLLPLSRIAYLHFVGHSRIDAMQVKITVTAGKKKKGFSFPVQLTNYEARGKYVFPMKGDLRLAFLPLSYIHHRGASSQEFAFDVVAANQQDAASFTEISRPNPKTLSDYAIWGREVMAIGDGIVVDIGNKFPEAKMSDPEKFGDPDYTKNLLKELVGVIGWPNAVAGNYVTIDHGNGEFSFYAHLKEGSLQVTPGDRVARGAVIGQVGNTGNSGAPHLHFQLMDSRDFFTANGLPLMFENLPASAMLEGYPIKSNSLIFSDNLFYAIP